MDDNNNVAKSNAIQRLRRHVQNTGFPIQQHTWERMWEHAKEVCPQLGEHEERIRHTELPPLAIPKPPTWLANSKIEEHIVAIQQYLESFQYNHIGLPLLVILSQCQGHSSSRSRKTSRCRDCWRRHARSCTRRFPSSALRPLLSPLPSPWAFQPSTGLQSASSPSSATNSTGTLCLACTTRGSTAPLV
jgi:hypothetical protein